jgi:hypothetical protein
MLFFLGVLIAIGAGVFFAALGLLTLWGGLDTLRNELPRDVRRTQARGGARVTTLTLVGLPLLITAFFGLLAAGRFIQVAFGLG